MPDASKYYVSNYLDSTITCISIGHRRAMTETVQVATKTINLLLGALRSPTTITSMAARISSTCGCPCRFRHRSARMVKYVVTANTLSGTITIIDTSTDDTGQGPALQRGMPRPELWRKVNAAGTTPTSRASSQTTSIVVDLNPTGSGLIADAAVVGRILLTSAPGTVIDDLAGVSAYAGMGGQGVLPVPNVYNGWVQKLPKSFCLQLKPQQRNPIGAPVSDNDCPLVRMSSGCRS